MRTDKENMIKKIVSFASNVPDTTPCPARRSVLGTSRAELVRTKGQGEEGKRMKSKLKVWTVWKCVKVCGNVVKYPSRILPTSSLVVSFLS